MLLAFLLFTLLAGARDIMSIFSIREKPAIIAVCFDANVKSNRYASAGRSGGYSEAFAVLGRFLGRAHTRLWDMKGNGQLYVKQTQLAKLGADEVSIEVAGECHPQLSCARETSLHSGKGHARAHHVPGHRLQLLPPPSAAEATTSC